MRLDSRRAVRLAMAGIKQIFFLRSRSLLAAVLFGGFALQSSALFAQLPELASPSTVTGAATTARFYAGATTDDGLSYGSSFGTEQLLDILAEIRVQPEHVNTVGNLYLLLVVGADILMRVESGDFVLWDGTFESLQAISPAKTLQASEPLNIIGTTAQGLSATAGASLQVYLAYDTTAAAGQLYYSGAPLSFAIDAAASDPASFTFYTANISTPIVQMRCIFCHSSSGIAQSSSLVYVNSTVPDFQQTNYNALVNYIENIASGSSLILSKPQGIGHGGGVQLLAGSSESQLWSEFVASSLNDIANSGGSTGTSQNIFSAVVKMDNEQTLRKAALLFAGRLPTEQESNSVIAASEDELAIVIRGLMSDDGFEKFLMESANNRFLTEAFTYNVFSFINRFRYPNSYQYYQTPNTFGSDKRLTAEALAREPLKLISHVVTNERPYTEILTADYIMVNPYSAEVYGGSVSFDDASDPDEWREGRITEYYRCTVCATNEDFANYDIPTVYPHAGILNSPAFLGRFPSTDTNRNRARARWTYYFFLGVDIEGLSERSTDQAALADENNPTLNNPNCTVCHNIMDPVASAFQNYGDDGFYKDQPGGENSLPRYYRNDSYSGYHEGDNWYSDMLAPGFGEKLAPSTDNSLQWLAQEFVSDSRFGYGAVNFWYPAVMGRIPYAEPENPEDPDYQSRLAAYAAEQEMMQTVAQRFVAGSAGNGDHNLKDMLVDLVLSDHFRAASVDSLSTAQLVELEDVGSGKLLTPEQLNRKLLNTTGQGWAYGRYSALEDVYKLIYGGIDSYGITERATEITTLMSSVITAMANELSCPMTARDFALTQNQRRLFPFVELSNLPTTSPSAIRSNIQYLHSRFLGEELAIDDPEIDATFSLFNAVWSARIAAQKGADISSELELCILDDSVSYVENDPHQTLRSWAAVVNYMLRDYKFIHE